MLQNLRSFAGVVLVPLGIAVVGLGFTILLFDTRYFLPWVGPLFIVIGVVVVVVALIPWVPWEALFTTSNRPTLPPYDFAPQGRFTFWLNRPPIDDKSFFGRAADLEAIAFAFQGYRAVVVYGGTGYGKTRLAAEYTRFSRCQGFWTNAGDSVSQTLVQLALNLDIKTAALDEEGIVREVKARIRQLPPGTLWVVDNLGNLDQVNALLSDLASVTLLVTTRDNRYPVLAPSVKAIGLDVLDTTSAVALLCSRSEFNPRDLTLRKIAEAVGYLPLALEMLAVQLSNPGQDPGTILAALHRNLNPIHLQRFRETEGFSIPRSEGVFAAITGALSQLSTDSRDRLSTLGYIADAPVPLGLFEALTGLEGSEAEHMCEECGRQSIIARTGDQIRIHPLTVAALKATNAEGALATAASRGLVRLAGINTDDPVALRGEIMHHERILAHARHALGDEHSQVGAYANNLAIGYSDLGRTAEAVKLDEETLKVRERVLGPEHPDTLRSRSNLASGYRALGRDADADKLESGV
jgi:hypothetical protein